MQVRHVDKKLERLETDVNYTAGFDAELIKSYRKVMGIIRAAPDERTFYAFKGLHYEKLQGKRKHERSMRLNRYYRLVLETREENGRTAVIVSVEDYH